MSWAGRLPLSEFPLDKRAEIERLASQASAPPRWIYFGGDFPLAAIESRAWYEWHHRHQALRRKIRRQKIVERDGLICGLCGGPVDPLDVEIDHIFPVSLGGSSDPSNLQVAHSLCNRRKGNRVMQEALN